jgi:hypothetical protein
MSRHPVRSLPPSFGAALWCAPNGGISALTSKASFRFPIAPQSASRSGRRCRRQSADFCQSCSHTFCPGGACAARESVGLRAGRRLLDAPGRASPLEPEPSWRFAAVPRLRPRGRLQQRDHDGGRLRRHTVRARGPGGLRDQRVQARTQHAGGVRRCPAAARGGRPRWIIWVRPGSNCAERGRRHRARRQSHRPDCDGKFERDRDQAGNRDL